MLVVESNSYLDKIQLSGNTFACTLLGIPGLLEGTGYHKGLCLKLGSCSN